MVWAVWGPQVLNYSLFGISVCCDGWCELLGIGRKPRMTRLLRAVRNGQPAAPIDARKLKRPRETLDWQTSEVCSFFDALHPLSRLAADLGWWMEGRMGG